MAYTITELDLRLACPITDRVFDVIVAYEPVWRSAPGMRNSMTVYGGTIDLTTDQLDSHIVRKLERLREALTAALPSPPEIDLRGVRRQGRPRLTFFGIEWAESIEDIEINYLPSDIGENAISELLKPDTCSGATLRLIDNLRPSFEQLAWSDLHKRLTGWWRWRRPPVGAVEPVSRLRPGRAIRLRSASRLLNCRRCGPR